MSLKKSILVSGQLTSSIATEYGVVTIDDKTSTMVIPDVYVKINNIQMDKSEVNLYVSFVGNGMNFYKKYTFDLGLDSLNNTFKDGYIYLKTLEEFKDVEDC